MRLDPDKVEAIRKCSPPENVQELKRVIGKVNYLGKYVSNLATVGQPLYELLKTKTVWTCDHAQQAAFQHLKELLISLHQCCHSTTSTKAPQSQQAQAAMGLVVCYCSSMERIENWWRTTPDDSLRPKPGQHYRSKPS
ncbi:hypothetical protein AAFF_G00249610 [Aldrovandia affinis]|uniref:Reverse transcriptase/retrotransposon-derived protein RNase H-like domain-containing protein n=1 Tax=Aldrovandia affinis TaxID=143900 RepID=A0AAD7RCW3_9TELE|nr:hypothetical protein AAFF_G00249610 [Aldrovandia affinis]